MEKLISMTAFVLEQYEYMKSDILGYGEFIDRVIRYAQFLKQPLTLGMFVSCDEDGNVLEEPRDANKDILAYDWLHEQYTHKKAIYQQAKERVLFEGFDIIHIDKVRVTIQCGFTQLDYNVLKGLFENYTTIEELTNIEPLLTPCALKQIGL